MTTVRPGCPTGSPRSWRVPREYPPPTTATTPPRGGTRARAGRFTPSDRPRGSPPGSSSRTPATRARRWRGFCSSATTNRARRRRRRRRRSRRTSGPAGGYRATMVAAPGLVSGCGPRWAGATRARTTRAGRTRRRRWRVWLGTDRGGRWEAAAAVLGAAPGVVHALARALDEAEAGGDASCAATCAEAVAQAASVRGGRGERGAGAARERVDDAGVNRGGASGRLPSRVAGTTWKSSRKTLLLAVTFGKGQAFSQEGK